MSKLRVKLSPAVWTKYALLPTLLYNFFPILLKCPFSFVYEDFPFRPDKIVFIFDIEQNWEMIQASYCEYLHSHYSKPINPLLVYNCLVQPFFGERNIMMFVWPSELLVSPSHINKTWVL